MSGGCVPRGTGAGQWQESSRIDRSESLATRFALSAATEALSAAKWKPASEEDRARTGVCLGSSLPGLDDIVESGQHLKQGGYRRISPYLIPRILVNMPAGVISVKHALKGPNLAMATACATGIHCIGEAAEKIRHGVADVMVAGGTETSIVPVAVAGFARARALSTGFSSKPGEASRPFDSQRDGFVIGEGAGAVVLEDYGHAVQRGANILCEIVGYGLSGDAHHITAPSEEGFGAIASMVAALKDADLQASDVAFLVAHATSTPLGDAAEAAAIHSVFKDHCKKLHVTAFKGAIGHLLAAAGAVESIFAMTALSKGQVPAIRNLVLPDVGKCTQHMNFARSVVTLDADQPRVAVINSFGFGGTNTSLCIRSVL